MRPQYLPSAPQTQIQPQIIPQAPMVQPAGGGQALSMKTPQFFKSKELIQKLCKNIQSEIDYGNYEGAIKHVKLAFEEIGKYSTSQPYGLQPYQAKPKNATAQQQADLAAAKKLCKDAISELDFGNMDQCMGALYNAAMLVQKY